MILKKTVIRVLTYMQSDQNRAPLSPFKESLENKNSFFIPVDVFWFRILLYVFVCNYPFIPS